MMVAIFVYLLLCLTSLLIWGWLLFLIFMGRFPSRPAIVQQVTMNEQVMGNGLIVHVCIQFKEGSRVRHNCFTFSGYLTHEKRIREKAEALKYELESATLRYHSLPYFHRVGSIKLHSDPRIVSATFISCILFIVVLAGLGYYFTNP
jgi:hypothetical protein